MWKKLGKNINDHLGGTGGLSVHDWDRREIYPSAWQLQKGSGFFRNSVARLNLEFIDLIVLLN